ncbi:putative E3 ubiquitin-protein ligase ARI2 [Capsicum annuum]|uniref:probable E3 ubiquitin-protein ligase ARI2 n=1 Tax=Capsicum annuum TaxID=4072 RepID=UPI001FB08664|nr:probable E3 ubiquitin-protein ligase ARI2 [Capsicum annuum]KAF3665082.1 putative E3 ubiquitin-protein ligase ARI2 [Capsicum annuum]
MEDYIYISSDDDEWDNNQDYNNDDDDDCEFDDGFSEIEQQSIGICQKAPSCKVIRKESLLAAQKEDLQRVMDLLSLKEHHARSLLIHYRWEADKVFAVFVERGSEKLYAEAGVTLEGKDELTPTLSTAELTCQICFEDVPVEQTTVMDCNHRFCNDCWTTHFSININEGKSKRVTCMAQKCNVICDEGKIRDLVTAKDPILAEKFDRFLLESYIDDNKRVKWCPSVPHCGNAIRIEDDEYCCEVECACGVQFCFNCLSEAHSPCSCMMWRLWMTKCKNDGKTVMWINENAKHCPKCHHAVEKNGGCNLVRCRCGQPFCWLCGGATGFEHTWSSIQGHTCGIYKEGEKDKAANVRNDLLRYTYYYERYMVHCDSLKLEANMKEKLHSEVLLLEARELQSKDFSWAENGLCRLRQSRRILSCSYPVSFYVFGQSLFKNEMTPKEMEIKQNLFENLQQQLEINVERLSMFLEEPFAEYPEEKVLETRMKIMTLSTVTDNLCEKLYDCIDNDLLVTLEQATHTIARYSSNGVAKASELPN